MRVENTGQIYSNAAVSSKKLQTAFIEEMIGHILPKPVEGAFSGGIGEEQFASFLNREYATALSASLDLGLRVGDDG